MHSIFIPYVDDEAAEELGSGRYTPRTAYERCEPKALEVIPYVADNDIHDLNLMTKWGKPILSVYA